jgi:hypothetical protein
MSVDLMLAALVPAAFAAGALVQHRVHRHRLAQLLDVDQVRNEALDRQELERQNAQLTMRAARYHRLWCIAQQVARAQAELLVARRRPPIVLPATDVPDRDPVPVYGARVLGSGR